MSIQSFLEGIAIGFVDKHVPILVIDGNISAGKTTICMTLAEESSRIKVLLEHGHEGGVLDLWAQDKRLTGMFQALMMGACFERSTLSHVLSQYAKSSFDLIVNDRSIKGNTAFEAVSHHDNGDMNDEENDLYKTAVRARGMLPFGHCDLSLFLWVEPAVCHSRNISRGVEIEVSEYTPHHFVQINDAHYFAVLENLTSSHPQPQIVLDWGVHHGKMANLYAVLGKYFKEYAGTIPAILVLTKSLEYFETHKNLSDFTAHLDLSSYTLDTEHVQRKIMQAVGFTTEFTAPKRVLALVASTTPKTWMSGSFKLTFT